MKIVNTSKSIYNTVLMIVTINTLVIPPIPNRIKNLLNPISIPHTRRYRQKLNLTIIEIKTRNIRSLNFSSINESTIYEPLFHFFPNNFSLPPSSPCALFIIRNFNITDRRRRTAKSKRIWICINYRSPSTTGRLPQHTTTHQYRSFFLRQAQPTRQAS